MRASSRPAADPRPLPRFGIRSARLGPLLALALASAAGGLAGCLGYDPAAEELEADLEADGAGGAAWIEEDPEDPVGEAGGSTGAAEGWLVGRAPPAFDGPPTAAHDPEASDIEVRSGELCADPSPDPWR